MGRDLTARLWPLRHAGHLSGKVAFALAKKDVMSQLFRIIYKHTNDTTDGGKQAEPLPSARDIVKSDSGSGVRFCRPRRSFNSLTRLSIASTAARLPRPLRWGRHSHHCLRRFLKPLALRPSTRHSTRPSTRPYSLLNYLSTRPPLSYRPHSSSTTDLIYSSLS